jgi:hypothetical protein
MSDEHRHSHSDVETPYTCTAEELRVGIREFRYRSASNVSHDAHSRLATREVYPISSSTIVLWP